MLASPNLDRAAYGALDLEYLRKVVYWIVALSTSTCLSPFPHLYLRPSSSGIHAGFHLLNREVPGSSSTAHCYRPFFLFSSIQSTCMHSSRHDAKLLLLHAAAYSHWCRLHSTLSALWKKAKCAFLQCISFQPILLAQAQLLIGLMYKR